MSENFAFFRDFTGETSFFLPNTNYTRFNVYTKSQLNKWIPMHQQIHGRRVDKYYKELFNRKFRNNLGEIVVEYFFRLNFKRRTHHCAYQSNFSLKVLFACWWHKNGDQRLLPWNFFNKLHTSYTENKRGTMGANYKTKNWRTGI